MDKVVFKVWRVIEGPYEDEFNTWWLVCLVEDVEDSELFEDEIPFINFDAAYDFKKHFDSSIDPIVLEFEQEKPLGH